MADAAPTGGVAADLRNSEWLRLAPMPRRPRLAWAADLGDIAGAGSTTVARRIEGTPTDVLALRTGYRSYPGDRVQVRDVRTGSVWWTSDPIRGIAACLGGGSVLVCEADADDGGTRVIAFDVRDGRVVHEQHAPGWLATYAAPDGTFFVVTADALTLEPFRLTIQAYRPDGRELWHRTYDRVERRPPPTGFWWVDGMLLVQPLRAPDGREFIVEAATGDFATDRRGGFTLFPVGTDRLTMADATHVIGAGAGPTPLPGPVQRVLVDTSGRAIGLVTGPPPFADSPATQHVMDLDADPGRHRWSVSTGWPYARCGDVVIGQSAGRDAMAFRWDTGALAWTRPCEGPHGLVGLASDGTRAVLAISDLPIVFRQERSAVIEAVSLTDGSTQWSWSAGELALDGEFVQITGIEPVDGGLAVFTRRDDTPGVCVLEPT